MPSPAQNSTAQVATLVVDPSRPTLSDAFIARAAQALPGFAASRWLDPGRAADLYFESRDDARAAIAQIAAGKSSFCNFCFNAATRSRCSHMPASSD